MNRLRTVFLSLAFVAAFLLLGKPALAARENIIVVQTDDQSLSSLRALYRGPNGKMRQTMPYTLANIFQSGKEFKEAYVASPLCSPSRAALLSGQYPHNNGLETNDGPSGGWSGWQALPLQEENIPMTLQEQGYHTAHLGKFTNSYWQGSRPETRVPPGWDDWYTTSFLSGEARYYGYMVNSNGRVRGPFGRKNYDLRRGVDRASCRVDTKGCNYLSDRMTRRATEIIRQTDRPLFLQIDYQAPHGDMQAPVGPQPASRHTFSAKRTLLRRTANFNEADFSDKPQFIRERYPRLSQSQRKQIRRNWQRSLESLRAVDEGVRAIFAALRSAGKLEQSYVVFTSDNGFFFGEHRIPAGKSLPYEEAARVPLAISGPGLEPGKMETPVSNVDLAATILDIAEAEPAYPIDGVSLLQEPVSRGILFQMAPSASRPGFAALRLGDYKFIRYSNGQEELYNLFSDRQETNNLALDPLYEGLRMTLAAELERLEDCSGASCRQAFAGLR